MIFKYLKFSQVNCFVDLRTQSAWRVEIPGWVLSAGANKENIVRNLLNCEYKGCAIIDCENQDFGMSIDWGKVGIFSLKDPTDYESFVKYTEVVLKFIPRFCNLITSPEQAWSFIRRFHWKISMLDRPKELEELISQNESYAYMYGEMYDVHNWSVEEVKRSPAWIYQYCKAKGFNEDLYKAITFFSFSAPNSEYVKKFMNTKRFVPKDIRKKVLPKTQYVRNIIKKLRKECDFTSSAYDIQKICERNGYDVSTSIINKVLNE